MGFSSKQLVKKLKKVDPERFIIDDIFQLIDTFIKKESKKKKEVEIKPEEKKEMYTIVINV